MEKKTYIAPAVMVEVLETETLMLTASSGMGMYDTGGKEQSLGNNRDDERQWGNIWN